MTSNSTTRRSTHFSRTRIAFAALAAMAMSGCAAQTGLDDESDGDIVAADSALMRGGGSTHAGYLCRNGKCTCDKSIENDCENMSAECTDATLDALIACINGWLTTDCICTQAFVVKPSTTYTVPIGGGVLARW